ncbi:XkdQ/YqbQ family protein [Brevibacillus sp. TJ4]|uniref:XkdQ/YqbQ family protein n=1 Tax=Brevibacillus sp. TJ4 TaxID=3234853 RepID=UPI0037D19CD4
MKVIYGKESTRYELTPAVSELSWTSSRGQVSQSCEVRVRAAPPLEAAGFLMLFSGTELKESQQFFHGPLVNPSRDDKTGDLTATAYELSWFLQKNEFSRIKVDGDAGDELRRIIRSTGISFDCPKLGFVVKERLSPQSYTALFTQWMEQAYEKTGVRYFLHHTRDKLSVVPEGGNGTVPLFQASMLDSSTTGESIEDVYTVVTVERYRDDKLMRSVTREEAGLIRKIGRMQKVIDAGEETNLDAVATKQLRELSKIPRTRSITVKHSDDQAARLRAGWLIRIRERDASTTEWIVTSSQSHWKGGLYTVNLQLERRS